MAPHRIGLALAIMGLLASPAFAASPLMTLLDTNKDGAVEVAEIEGRRRGYV
jgi:hypothetical protein